MRFKRLAVEAIGPAAIAVAAEAPAYACPMCKTAIAGAENAVVTAGTVNSAILILLIPTLAIIGGIVRMVFKYRNYQDSNRPAITYVNQRSSDSQRNTEQHQRDPAVHGIPFHSSKAQGSP
jgi:hypothetical protein